MSSKRGANDTGEDSASAVAVTGSRFDAGRAALGERQSPGELVGGERFSELGDAGVPAKSATASHRA